jgi:hypothetical protein
MKNNLHFQDGTLYDAEPVSDALNHGSVSVGTSAVLLLPAANYRRSVLIQNLSVNDVYIGGAAVTINNAPKLMPGADITVYGCAPIYVIASGVASDVRYIEEV